MNHWVPMEARVQERINRALQEAEQSRLASQARQAARGRNPSQTVWATLPGPVASARRAAEAVRHAVAAAVMP